MGHFCCAPQAFFTAGLANLQNHARRVASQTTLEFDLLDDNHMSPSRMLGDMSNDECKSIVHLPL